MIYRIMVDAMNHITIFCAQKVPRNMLHKTTDVIHVLRAAYRCSDFYSCIRVLVPQLLLDTMRTQGLYVVLIDKIRNITG